MEYDTLDILFNVSTNSYRLLLISESTYCKIHSVLKNQNSIITIC